MVVGCIESGDNACVQDVQDNQPDSFALYTAMETCGYAACADPSGQSCADKCGEFNQTWPCNCDDACPQYGDCCDDWEELCQGGGTTGETTGCTPDCAGKECGDDGCGSSCGACDGGFSCDGGICVQDGCQDECTDGDNTCAGGQAFSCVAGPAGCLVKAADNCVQKGLVCVDGACIEDGGTTTGEATGETTAAATEGGTTEGTTEGGTTEATTTGGGSTGGTGNNDTTGCTASAGGTAIPLALAAGLLLFLGWRRKEE